MIRRTLLCLSVLLALLASSQAFASPEDELIGLWGYSTAFGPMLQGPLEISRGKGGWSASFAKVIHTTSASFNA